MQALAACSPRQTVTIKAIHSEETELILLRFGLGLGSVVTISAKPTGGPLVLLHQGHELALGRAYCDSIEVEGVHAA